MVVGFIAVFLLPSIKNILPDKNLALFKKANNTLFESIKTLVNSDKYYAQGNLSMMGKGGKVKSSTYFCETLADTLQTKSVNCSSVRTSAYDFETLHMKNAGFGQVNQDGVILEVTEKAQMLSPILLEALINFDNMCKDTASEVGAEIVLNNNTIFYQAKPSYTFYNLSEEIKKRTDKEFENDSGVFNDLYKVVCIDIDGINKKEEPFGYGISPDGQVIAGCKAQNWIIRSEKNKDKNYKELDCNASFEQEGLIPDINQGTDDIGGSNQGLL